MNLNVWATKWGVPFNAVEDLRVMIGVVNHCNVEGEGFSEAAVNSRVLIEASRKQIWLLRNNVGACTDKNGRVIRYGLANESKAQNKILKSSDLIGIKPVTITHNMIGQLIGQYIAREVKPTAWRYTGTEHEKGQLAFMGGILSRGGDAQFVTCAGSL